MKSEDSIEIELNEEETKEFFRLFEGKNFDTPKQVLKGVNMLDPVIEFKKVIEEGH